MKLWSTRMLAAALTSLSCCTVAIAQTPGTAPGDTVRRLDTVVTLVPLEVRASIAPVAGPAIGSAVPAHISVITARQINAWKPRTLAEALVTQTGVSLYDDLGSPMKLNLATRGFSVGPTVGLPPGVSVFLDGVRQNEPDAQEVNFDLLPMELVERIELLSGAASLLGPNSLGGAVNLVTRRGAGPPKGELEVSGGSFGTAAAQLSVDGGEAQGWNYLASGGYERERGWREATGSERSTGFLNLGRQGGSHGMILQAHATRSRAETAGSLPESIFANAPRTNFTAGDFEDLDVAQLALTGHVAAGRGVGSLSAYLRRSHAERFNVNQPPDENVRSHTANGSVGASVDWRWMIPVGGGTLGLRTGADGAAHQVSVRIFTEPQEAGGSPDRDSLTTDVRSPSLDLAGYGIADFRVGRVTLSTGARYDYVRVPFRSRLDPGDDTTSSFRRLNPRGGVTVQLGSGRSVYGSIGQSFRAPAILELACADPEASCPLPFALGDDPPLKPVRATTYEVGGRWARGALLLDASLYRTEVRDEIFFIASDVALLSGYFTNVAHTRRAGAEAAAQAWLLDGRALAFVNYAWTRATFESPAEIFSIRSDDEFAGSALAGPNDVEVGDRIPLTPEHQSKAGVLAHMSSVEVGVDARYIGRQWLRGDEANETRPLAPRVVTNARVGVRRENWNVSLLAANLLNSHRPTFGTFNENRISGELERFLTPMNARSLRVVVEREFGGRVSRASEVGAGSR